MAENKAGRPPEYYPDRCHELLDLMSRGYRGPRLHAKLGITRQTFARWRKEYPEYQEAYERGEDAWEAYWEGRLIHYMETGNKVAYPYLKTLLGRHRDEYKTAKPFGEATQINIGNMQINQDLKPEELIKRIMMRNRELKPVLNAIEVKVIDDKPREEE